MTFLLQPGYDGVELGGTVVVGDDGVDELSPLTAALMCVPSH